MTVKYIPYQTVPLRGQAVLPFLRYHKNEETKDFMLRGMPAFEVELVEKVGKDKTDNKIIHGDCLNACAYLKEKNIKVDLVYIDPPFASGANYAKKIYIRRNPQLVTKLEAIEAQELDNKDLQVLEETMYGDIWQKEDYLNWIYERLLAIKEIMSDTASIYVHLDWHIGHYVKVLMDEIFGEENFRNEIIWNYETYSGSVKNYFPRKHDTLFLYSKSDNYTFHLQYLNNEEDSINFSRWKNYIVEGNKIKGNNYPKTDSRFQQRLNKWIRDHKRKPNDDDIIFEIQSFAVSSTWKDIKSVDPKDLSEKIDYATQKPEALLERIIKSSTNEGMIVADFFGGSGVTAKVANDLGRTFITADVGVNAIETMRDRLVEAKASFEILEIKDGIDLFRNPAQTMDKLATIIPGLSTEHEYGKFWFGAITEKGSVCPCWVPNLLDKTQAILNKDLFNKILDEIAKLGGISKVVICSIDKIDEKEIAKMQKDYDLRDTNGNPTEIVFKDLKELTDLLVHPDIIEYTIKEKEVTITRFVSDTLITKIAEFNNKKQSKAKNITISDEGLELIEYISLDCSNSDGNIWKSDSEIKIDKKGYISVNGEKTKTFWNGKIISDKKPLRLKVRNIAGDETIMNL